MDETTVGAILSKGQHDGSAWLLDVTFFANEIESDDFISLAFITREHAMKWCETELSVSPTEWVMKTDDYYAYYSSKDVLW